MKPLAKDDLSELRALRQRIGYGFHLKQAELDALCDTWQARVEPDKKDAAEWFAVARPDGVTTGVVGPRWIFHLFGFSHRAAHVGFSSPNGQIVLQRRAPTKADWPDAWDMAAAGHVPQNPDGSAMSFEEGALKEIEEELGLPVFEFPVFVVERALQPVGAPYFCVDMEETRNPPFYNAESRQIFAATLTAEGLARILPDYEELSGIYLCPMEEAWDMMARERIASGLRYSLPRYLDWLCQHSSNGKI